MLAIPAALFTWAAVSQSCEFCQPDGPTLADDYSQAALVLLVHADKPAVYEGNSQYKTELVIDQVFKDHQVIKGKKTITMSRKAEVGIQFMVFCDVLGNGKIDPYRGVVVDPKGDLLKYFEGSRAKLGKPIAERLRYGFDYLNSSDLEAARDAYKQYANADYGDYKEMAKTLPADKIAEWIRDPKTPSFRVSLYASLLGHCGKAEHAKLLREKLNDAIDNRKPEIHGLLAGYFMLDTKEAFSYLKKVLSEEKEEFFVRHACLRMATFLREQRPDLVPAGELNKAVGHLLQFPVMADMGIDYLAKAKAWDFTGKVIDLYQRKNDDKNFDVDSIKRAVLRFALLSPEPRAAAFVKEQRARNAQYVTDTEELLQLSRAPCASHDRLRFSAPTR